MQQPLTDQTHISRKCFQANACISRWWSLSHGLLQFPSPPRAANCHMCGSLQPSAKQQCHAALWTIFNALWRLAYFMVLYRLLELVSTDHIVRLLKALPAPGTIDESNQQKLLGPVLKKILVNPQMRECIPSLLNLCIPGFSYGVALLALVSRSKAQSSRFCAVDFCCSCA